MGDGELSEQLWQAAVEGRVQDVRALVALGADVHAVNEYGYSALHQAAEQVGLHPRKGRLVHTQCCVG